jgi:hypothetical protein
MGRHKKLAVNSAPVQSAPVQSAPVPDQNVSGQVFVALCHPTGIKFSLPGGKTVLIKGNAHHLRGREKGVLPVGGFGLTPVDQADWEEIQRVYGRMEIFKNGMIFAQDSRAKATDESDEKAELRHGREPVDPATTHTEAVNVADLGA